MEKIEEKISRCIKSLQKAPLTLSERLVKLFGRLSDFLRKHPEFSERTMPVLLNVYRCILEGDYSEACEQLFLLLVLIELRRRRK